jgi:23S rRNA (uracil1939-C5)-methyltransferase
MSKLCAHFGTCGGCLLQDVPAKDYRAQKREMALVALARHGIEAEVAEIVCVPENSRRRAALKAAKKSGAVALGFRARASHDIVDMQECRVLTRAILSALPKLRSMMSALLRDGEEVELHLTDTETGLDLALNSKRALKPALTAELARRANEAKLARITLNGEVAVELARPVVRFGKVEVALPATAFLQPTREGEAVLQQLVRGALAGAKRIADLFSGCGTFSLVLVEKARIHAVEREPAMLAALTEAARHAQGLKPVTTEARDLFKLPLTPPELKVYDAVLLDPPRAGAAAQVRELAASQFRRIAYVSCNPESFARDARVLIDAGFRIGTVTPVDQFLWSDHLELVALFARR